MKCLNIETSSNELPDMLSALATKFCDGDSEAASKEAYLFHKAREPVQDADDVLLDDPLVDAVYEDMDDKDKGEFREIGQAKNKRKLAAKVRKWNATCEAQAKQAKRLRHRRVGRAKGKGKGKDKVKGKGKGKGKNKGKGKAATVPLPAPIPPAPIPLPAPIPSAPEAALVVAAVPTPADPRARGQRAANSYNLVGLTETIPCDNCAGVMGQKWKSEMPGNRDKATWYFTVWNHRSSAFYKKAPGLKTKQVQMFVHDDSRARKSEDEISQEINDWLQTNRGCCGGKLHT